MDQVVGLVMRSLKCDPLTEHILRESERVRNAYHQSGDGAMLQIALAPCTLLSCPKSSCVAGTAL